MQRSFPGITEYQAAWEGRVIGILLYDLTRSEHISNVINAVPRSAKRLRLCWVNTKDSGLFSRWNCSMEYIPFSNLLYTK